MRKMMTKEVTKTTVKLAKMEVVDGIPSAKVLEDKILLGNVAHETAQKLVTKELGQGVTVLSVQADTVTYELPVEKFLEVATIKVANSEEQTEAELTA
ncbi:MAG TPA: hypothetical protein VLG50_03250 [Candidatus Saccharimonadales bacterium]|nr:hypothetical protein [Candidatus Saccharimonadales bacterium]